MQETQERFWQEQESLTENKDKKQSMNTDEMQEHLQKLLTHKEGQYFVQELLQGTSIFEAMPIGNKEWYAWHEGRRSIGLLLYHRLKELAKQGSKEAQQVLTTI